LKGLGVADGGFGQGLAVEADVGLTKAGHELAIGEVRASGGGVDAHDPQAAEVAFTLSAASVGVGAGVDEGFLALSDTTAWGGYEASGALQNPLVSAVLGDASFDSGHFSIPI